MEELLAGATSREPFGTTDAKSGAAFERVVIDGESLIVKHVHIDDDWTMRFNGDIGCHPAQVWQAGLMDVMPERIDHGVIAVAAGLGRNGWGAAILMRDLSDAMVPPGDDLITIDATPDVDRRPGRPLGPHVGLEGRRRPRAARQPVDMVQPRVVGRRGRARLARPGPEDRVRRLAAFRSSGRRRTCSRRSTRSGDDPAPLVAAVRETPLTFVHGDWKLGNLGVTADGRTCIDRLDVSR